MTRLLTTLLIALGCAGCAGPAGSPAAPQALRPASHARAGSSPIQHVVIIIQENRTFDNMFQGYPGANTSPTGLDHNGNVIPLQPVSLAAGYDILHGLHSYLVSYDAGKNDGFDLEKVTNHPVNPHPQYGYVPPGQSAPYFAMAQQYVLDDNTFTSQIDGSFTAHQYLIAAQASRAVNFPSNGSGCPSAIVSTLNLDRSLGAKEPACFGNADPNSYLTLGDELDAAGLPWRFYAPVLSSAGRTWSAYHAVDHIYNGPDWSADIVSPPKRVLIDLAHGDLRAVTWVVPDVADSDHAGTHSASGPQWVASVVNAIGTSRFWPSTVIFVIWDDWGGWYDHVVPPQLDYDGLGFRVPLLCISPYAKQNYISHVQLESASILRFVEDNFGLSQLSVADARAADAGADCLEFGRQPRAFSPLATVLAPAYFLRRPPSARAPDDE